MLGFLHPLKNRLLSALPSEDKALLVPYLTPMELDKGRLLYDPGDAIDQVYFPNDGVISLMTLMESGAAIESATIGREGALGLMAAGAGLQFSSLARGKTLAVAVLTIKHLCLPLVAWGLSRAFGLTSVQTTMLLAFSALPTASSCYVLAARMGYDGAYVAGLVTRSTLLGVVSLPFALGVLR